MAHKYYVPGLPAGAAASAFLPHWDRYAASGAVQFKATVVGHPGTLAIPAPTGDTAPQGNLGDLALAGTSRSVNSPDVWYPSKYYDSSLNGGGAMGPVTPVRIYSDNLMPVPARDPRGKPARLSKPINQRGQRQIGMPRVIPKWGRGG
jgi:hypothetical protein